jgi:exonuclease III
MKILTWNLDYWKRTPEQRTNAWDYLFNNLNPDIALLQEIKPPNSEMDNKSFLYHEIDGKRKWGTALFSKFPIKRELYSVKGYEGASGLITAEISISKSLTLTLINIYGLLDNNGYATTTMHHLLSDLTPILDHKGTRQIILGGDFNVSKQFDEKYNWPSHKIVFDRIEDFGLVNCTQKFYSNHVQTHVHNKSKFEWQDDYLFTSDSLIDEITDCQVISGDKILEFSDHYPVTIELVK